MLPGHCSIHDISGKEGKGHRGRYSVGVLHSNGDKFHGNTVPEKSVCIDRIEGFSNP